jgi:putative transcriptional regulator
MFLVAMPLTDATMKNRLARLRTAKEWSQADLAEKLGVSRQTVNAIETERYDPSLPLAFKVAQLFKMRVEEVFERIRVEFWRCLVGPKDA